MSRSHESLWLWCAGGLLTLTAAFGAIAGGLDAARPHFALWTSAPMLFAYVAVALAVVCFVGAVREWPFPFAESGHARQPTPSTVASRSATPSAPSATPSAPTLRRNLGVTHACAPEDPSDSFSRVVSAVDSFGHRPDLSSLGSFIDTGLVLRPGQQVTFEVEASNPGAEDVGWRVITPSHRDDVLAMDGNVITWNVAVPDIADPAYVHIYLTSLRPYHRNTLNEADDTVTFIYRVLPALQDHPGRTS